MGAAALLKQPKRFLALIAVLAGAWFVYSARTALPVHAPVEGWIETHDHLMVFPASSGGEVDYEPSLELALQALDQYHLQKMLLLPMPMLPELPFGYDWEVLARVVRRYPGRLAFLAGGGSLNPMIQESVRAGRVTTEMLRRFEAKAREILAHGAVGFGEMAAEHIAVGRGFPYLDAPPDHPLFLLLSDIAARAGVPIDLHMEAVPRDEPLPGRFSSPPNPPTLRANLAGFERLLDHNPKTIVIWNHLGRDWTGHRTPGLMRQMLQRHPNLVLAISPVPGRVTGQNLVTGEDGAILAEWLELFREFPERFLMASDQIFFPEPPWSPHRLFTTIRRWTGHMDEKLDLSGDFLFRLPPDLRRKIGSGNARRIYKLDRTAHLVSPAAACRLSNGT